jgi:hypothetical protein
MATAGGSMTVHVMRKHDFSFFSLDAVKIYLED